MSIIFCMPKSMLLHCSEAFFLEKQKYTLSESPDLDSTFTYFSE